MSPRRRANLSNLLVLQLGAGGPLVLAAIDRRMLGVALAWAAVGLALALSRRRAADVRLLLLGAVLGTAGEGSLAAAGLMTFTHPLEPLPFPGWLSPSWALVGMATAYVLAPLRGRPVMATLAGIGVGALGLYGAVAAGEIVVASAREGVLVSAALGVSCAVLVAGASWIDPPAAGATTPTA